MRIVLFMTRVADEEDFVWPGQLDARRQTSQLPGCLEASARILARALRNSAPCPAAAARLPCQPTPPALPAPPAPPARPAPPAPTAPPAPPACNGCPPSERLK